MTIEDIINIDPTCRWKIGADHCLDINTYSERKYNSFTIRNYQCKSCQKFNEIADYNHLVLPQAFTIRNYQCKSCQKLNEITDYNHLVLPQAFSINGQY